VEPSRGDLARVEQLKRYTVEEINQLADDFGLPFTARYGVVLYMMEYWTVGSQGEHTLASGAIGIPQPAIAEFSIVSLQSATTVQRTSVPSRGGVAQTLIGMLFSADGYVTVMPDMIGLGSSMEFHPYLVADQSATTVIDLLRAVNRWSTTESWNLSRDVYLAGYSSGGYVTMATHRAIEAEYSDEFTVAASAPMAGPYDLSGTMLKLILREEPYGQPYFLPYVLLSYNHTYNLYNSPSDFLLSPYDEILPPLFDGTHTSSEINEVMPDIPIHIIRNDVLQSVREDNDHQIVQRLRENDLINWSPRSKIRLYHCAADELIPIENSQIAAHEFGAIASLVDPSPESDHTGCAFIAIAGTRAWFNSISSIPPSTQTTNRFR